MVASFKLVSKIESGWLNVIWRSGFLLVPTKTWILSCIHVQYCISFGNGLGSLFGYGAMAWHGESSPMSRDRDRTPDASTAVGSPSDPSPVPDPNRFLVDNPQPKCECFSMFQQINGKNDEMKSKKTCWEFVVRIGKILGSLWVEPMSQWLNQESNCVHK